MRTAALFLLPLLLVAASTATPVLQELTPGEKTAYVQLSEAPTGVNDSIYTIRQTVGSSTQFVESGPVTFAAGARATTVTYTKNVTPGNYTFSLLLGGSSGNTSWTVSENKAFAVVAPVPTPTPTGSTVDLTITSPSSGARLDLSQDVTVSGTASHKSGVAKVWIAFRNGGGVTCDQNKQWEGPISGTESWKYQWGLKSDSDVGTVWDPGKYSILVKAVAKDGTPGCIEVYPFPVFRSAQNLTPTPTPVQVEPQPAESFCNESVCVVSWDATTNGTACWVDPLTRESGPCPIIGQEVKLGGKYEGKPPVSGKQWCVTITAGNKKKCTDSFASRAGISSASSEGCLPAPYLDQYGKGVQTFSLQRNNPAFVYTPQWHQGDKISCSFNAAYRYVVTSSPGGVIYDTARMLDAQRSDHMNFTIPEDSKQIAIEGTTSDKPGNQVTLIGATEVVQKKTTFDLLGNYYFLGLLVVVITVASSARPKLFIPTEEEPTEPIEIPGASPILDFEVSGRNYHAFLSPYWLRKFPLNYLPGSGNWTIAVMELPPAKTKIIPTKGRLFRNIYTMPLPTTKQGSALYPKVLKSEDEAVKHFYEFPGYNGHGWHWVFAAQPKGDPRQVEIDLNFWLKETPEEEVNAVMRRLNRRAERLHPTPKPAAPAAPEPQAEGKEGREGYG